MDKLSKFLSVDLLLVLSILGVFFRTANCWQDPEQRELMDLLCWGQLRQLYSDHSLDKQGRDSRMFQIRDDVITKIRALKPGWDPTVLNDVFSAVSRDAVRSLIFEENIRVDGRWVANEEQLFPLHNTTI